jgi:hypothetical protein
MGVETMKTAIGEADNALDTPAMIRRELRLPVGGGAARD